MKEEKSGSSLLSLFDLTMIVIGLVIGLGIFRTAADSAKAAITPEVFFFSLVIWRCSGPLRRIDLC